MSIPVPIWATFGSFTYTYTYPDNTIVHYHYASFPLHSSQ